MYRNARMPVALVYAVVCGAVGAHCVSGTADKHVLFMGTPQCEVLGREVQSTNLTVRGSLREILVPGPTVNAVTFCKAGTVLAVGRAYANSKHNMRRGPIEIWNLNGSRLQTAFGIEKHANSDAAGVVTIACSPDSKTLASLHFDDKIRFWSLENYRKVGELSCTSQRIAKSDDMLPPTFMWTSNTSIVATTNNHTAIARYDYRCGKRTSTFARVLPSSVVSFFKKGDFMCVQDWDWEKKRFVISIRAVGTGKIKHTLCERKDDNETAIISPTSDTIVIPATRKLFIWDARSGRLLHTLPRAEGAAGAVVFSGDGKLIASDDGANGISIWNPITGKLVKRLNSGGIGTKLAFAPSDRALAGASDDGTIRIWRL